MVTKAITAANIGINSCKIEVEVDVTNSLPSMSIVGLPDSAVSEARERVHSAIKNSGYTFPQGKTVNEIASKYSTGGSDLDEVVANIIAKKAKTEFEKVKDSVEIPPEKNLLDETQNIGDLKKYNMSLQNVQISADLREQIKKHYRDSSMKNT